MGRKAGVTAQETKAGLLKAAAVVFGRRGYEGATISEIASEAKLSSGSIYAHYKGKAQLFLAVLEEHGRSELARHLRDDTALDVAQFLIYAGSNLDRRPIAERTLLVEAIMAAKHDPEVRSALSAWFTDQHEFFRTSLRAAQEAGRLRRDFSPAAAARFAAAVALGTLLLDVLDVPRPGQEDWSQLIRDVVGSLQADPPAPPRLTRRSRSATG